MKPKKLFATLAIMVSLLFLTPYTFTYVNSQEVGEYPDFDWSLVYPDGIDDQEVIDGGDAGEITITCSSDTWGRCFRWYLVWEKSNSIFGEYRCNYTGNPKHYCHHLYAKLANMVYVLKWFE
ncbi:MAG: hypothetical protein FJY11_06530 [Bacteroidetes bacterium]|nr:hypothetical protein [Bacteroidota bacterium]